MVAATFILGAIAQLSGILLGAGELLGAHQRARDHLDGSAEMRDLVHDSLTTADESGARLMVGTASDDLGTLRGALAAAELNRNRVVAALVLLCAGVLITLGAALAAL
jgi:hypothetical protein